jgi:kynurenine formamidase
LIEARHQNGSIAGIASLSYRLSPYPSHQTDPSNPSDASRNVKHPEHLNDVLAGIKYLQDRYHFGSQYAIIGHSCGATMAFEAVQRILSDSAGSKLATPQAIVGIAGLYDLIRLRDSDEYPPLYQTLISNAFGDDEKVWKEASPADVDFDIESWNARLVILVTCKEDEYVPLEQLELMNTKLENISWNERPQVKDLVVNGRHDDCSALGFGLADCVEKVVELLYTSA